MNARLADHARGLVWGEGPRWHKGALWLSDTQGGRLWTDASGRWTGTAADPVSNGLWFLPDGRLVGALMRDRRVGVWTGTGWDTYADLSGLGVGPLGDMVGDAAGNLYVDDVAFDAAAGEPPAPGRIILVRPDGSAEVAAEGVEFPNGMALLDDGATLVVAETARQRLTAFTVGADRTLSAPRPYADIAALVGGAARPDGIWPARDGGVWVATTTGQAVAHVRDGALVTAVPTAPDFPVACCAADDGTLFVTLASTDGEPLFAALARRAVTTRVVTVAWDGGAP
ncbi:SMP-30/gluconolactonase/LRE family protein [Streptomyces radicis]|uniref:SMP-30/gluconolactonase/LRE family protein n=1 Tax=Streptomyces radicis TaxID=1750517 RepID=UPI001600282A|nr:SMP-30/gluconolactonase/LRE family protein [Streptomyces radicis]